MLSRVRGPGGLVAAALSSERRHRAIGHARHWSSRLVRTDKDFCHLLEVCQIFGTLIADDAQIYDVGVADDLLVLGIKGALHPARREALLRYVLRPPVAQERVELRPDGLVRITLKMAYADGTIAVDLD